MSKIINTIFEIVESDETSSNIKQVEIKTKINIQNPIENSLLLNLLNNGVKVINNETEYIIEEGKLVNYIIVENKVSKEKAIRQILKRGHQYE